MSFSSSSSSLTVERVKPCFLKKVQVKLSARIFLQEFTKTMKTKEKKTFDSFSQKTWISSLATHMRVFEKGDEVGVEATGVCSQRNLLVSTEAGSVCKLVSLLALF